MQFYIFLCFLSSSVLCIFPNVCVIHKLLFMIFSNTKFLIRCTKVLVVKNTSSKDLVFSKEMSMEREQKQQNTDRLAAIKLSYL